MFRDLGRLKDWFFRKSRVLEPELCTEELERWLETPFGQYLYKRQQECVKDYLPTVGGYRAMQLGLSPKHHLLDSLEQLHKFYIGPGSTADTDVSALSRFDSLPLPNDSLDVVLLHHALDFSPRPHSVLSEATRVVVPGGHIILLGFNPFSAFGSVKIPMQFLSPRCPWHRQMLRAGRVKDWLQVLGCQPVTTMRGCFQLPIQSARYLEKMSGLEAVTRNSGLPLGAFYMIIARKQVLRAIGAPPQKWAPAITPLGVRRQAHARKRRRSDEVISVRDGEKD